jgi:hypothetical protein
MRIRTPQGIFGGILRSCRDDAPKIISFADNFLSNRSKNSGNELGGARSLTGGDVSRVAGEVGGIATEQQIVDAGDRKVTRLRIDLAAADVQESLSAIFRLPHARMLLNIDRSRNKQEKNY